MAKTSAMSAYMPYTLAAIIVVVSLSLVLIAGYYQIHSESVSQPQMSNTLACQSNNDCVNFCEHSDCIVPTCTISNLGSSGICHCLNMCGNTN